MSLTPEYSSVLTPKILLPGEYGYSFDHVPIGTFAVGSINGCRGYLIYDAQMPLAGLAHVDYFNLDQAIIDEMTQILLEQGAKNLILGHTPNSTLTFPNRPTVILPTPAFIYHPKSKVIAQGLERSLMEKAFSRRGDDLKNRLKTVGSPLIKR